AASADECVAAIAAANDAQASAAQSRTELDTEGDRVAPETQRALDADEEGETRDASQLAAELAAVISDEAPLHPHAAVRDPAAEALRWARALSRQCHGALDELYALADASPDEPDLEDDDTRNARMAGDVQPIPTLREAARSGNDE